MAEPYLTRLNLLVDKLDPLQIGNAALESKHFFSGAALYANGKIFASLSPAGLAVKLPEDERKGLIENGDGMEFRFFPNGPIKKNYLALSEAIMGDEGKLRELIEMSARYVLGSLDSSLADR